jgi:hypothetical protein
LLRIKIKKYSQFPYRNDLETGNKVGEGKILLVLMESAMSANLLNPVA